MANHKYRPFISRLSVKLIWLAHRLGTLIRTVTQKMVVIAASKLRTVAYKKTKATGKRLKLYIKKAPKYAGKTIKKIYKKAYEFADSKVARKMNSQQKKSADVSTETGGAKTTEQIQHPISRVNDPAESNSGQHKEPDEIPSKCLMCEELVRCVYRQNKTYCSEVQARIANEQ